MKRLRIAITSLAGVFGVLMFLWMPVALAGDVPRMTVDELKGHLGSPEVVIIDVRSGDDWKSSSSKILGAERGDPRNFIKWAERYPKDKTLVLY